MSVYLTTPFVSHTLDSVEWSNIRWTKNYTGCGKERTWPDFRFCYT